MPTTRNWGTISKVSHRGENYPNWSNRLINHWYTVLWIETLGEHSRYLGHPGIPNSGAGFWCFPERDSPAMARFDVFDGLDQCGNFCIRYLLISSYHSLESFQIFGQKRSICLEHARERIKTQWKSLQRSVKLRFSIVHLRARLQPYQARAWSSLSGDVPFGFWARLTTSYRENGTWNFQTYQCEQWFGSWKHRLQRMFAEGLRPVSCSTW